MAADGHSPFNQSSSVKSRILRGALKKDGAVEKLPGFALELTARTLGVSPVVSQNGDVDLDGYSIPGAASNILTLNFDGRPGAIPIYSFGDLFHCAEQGETSYFERSFAGKTVVMGAVLDLQDRRLASNRFIVAPDALGALEGCLSTPQESLGIARRAHSCDGD